MPPVPHRCRHHGRHPGGTCCPPSHHVHAPRARALGSRSSPGARRRPATGGVGRRRRGDGAHPRGTGGVGVPHLGRGRCRIRPGGHPGRPVGCDGRTVRLRGDRDLGRRRRPGRRHRRLLRHPHRRPVGGHGGRLRVPRGTPAVVAHGVHRPVGARRHLHLCGDGVVARLDRDRGRRRPRRGRDDRHLHVAGAVAGHRGLRSRGRGDRHRHRHVGGRRGPHGFRHRGRRRDRPLRRHPARRLLFAGCHRAGGVGHVLPGDRHVRRRRPPHRLGVGPAAAHRHHRPVARPGPPVDRHHVAPARHRGPDRLLRRGRARSVGPARHLVPGGGHAARRPGPRPVDRRGHRGPRTDGGHRDVHRAGRRPGRQRRRRRPDPGRRPPAGDHHHVAGPGLDRRGRLLPGPDGHGRRPRPDLVQHRGPPRPPQPGPVLRGDLGKPRRGRLHGHLHDSGHGRQRVPGLPDVHARRHPDLRPAEDGHPCGGQRLPVHGHHVESGQCRRRVWCSP